jgi:predicted nucleic-acid-binding protein
VRITPDTNVLVRAAVGDEKNQARAARAALASAQVIAIAPATLCEFVWVLRTSYKRQADQIIDSIRSLIAEQRVRTDRPAIEAGLAVLSSGGDFADGIIAHEGRQLGGDVFVTFDQKAAKLISAAGGGAELLPSA